jgi:predicted RNA-binding protein with PUA-like domain
VRRAPPSEGLFASLTDAGAFFLPPTLADEVPETSDRPAAWLLKTEPEAYSFDDLVRDGRTVWDGVTNPVALKNLRAMRRGDRVVIYHTGKEKRAVGLAKVVRPAYPDPEKGDERLAVVDLEADKPLPRRVTLAELKAESTFEDSPLIRQGRLSVVPLSRDQLATIEALARQTG